MPLKSVDVANIFDDFMPNVKPFSMLKHFFILFFYKPYYDPPCKPLGPKLKPRLAIII